MKGVQPIPGFWHKTARLTVQKADLRRFSLTTAVAIAVFVRMLFAEKPFSFDYDAYINIFENIEALSFSEIIGNNLIFPYTIAQGIVPIEFGFALLVKAASLLCAEPETIFAVIASLSVALRVHVMRSVGTPILWIVLVNIFAITLFEANALRLGVAASVLLFGMRQLYRSRNTAGFLIIGISIAFHLQLIFFVAPFILFYFFLPWMNRSRLHLIIALSATSAATVTSASYFSIIKNDKIQEYISLGSSSSSGITATSVLAFFVLLFTAATMRTGKRRNSEARLFSAVIAASVPALVLLIFLTNIAVIGDRAWQLGFVVLTTFFFTSWATKQEKKLAYTFLSLLMAVALTNVALRYPLSDFFSPPFPGIDPVVFTVA